MRRFAPLLLVAMTWAGAGCRPLPPATPRLGLERAKTATPALEIVSIARTCDWASARAPVRACTPGTLELRAIDLQVGEPLVVIDGQGYAGLARVTRRDICLDCTFPWTYTAEPTAGRGPQAGGMIFGVGPLAEAQPRASFHPMPDTPLDPDWRPAVTIDLDGDGRAELELVVRCNDTEAMRSNRDHGCQTYCAGTRAAGGGAVAHMMCAERN